MNEKLNLSESLMEQENTYGAHNYSPLPVVLTKAKGVYAWDVNGVKYVDMMSAYSAVSLGHSNKALTKTLIKQAKKLGVTSRAFYNDKLPLMLERLTRLAGMDQALPMNTGAEAVDTAIKLARKWGEKVKGIAKDKTQIIACQNNFHGRTLGAISMSTEPQYRDGFGPFLPGIKTVEYGNLQALEKAINPNTAAFIIEPIQGEAGIVMPPEGFLKSARELCSKHNVLFVCDEIQTGLARTGKLFCFEHHDIKPDMVIVGKALGGGIYPVSAVLANKEVMGVMTPGDHGSTFGGNALASAVAYKALELISDEELIQHVDNLGKKSLDYLSKHLGECKIVKNIRGQGLFIGIELSHELSAKTLVKELLKHGILTKDTHEFVIRIAPPLVIKEKTMMKALARIVEVIKHHEVKSILEDKDFPSVKKQVQLYEWSKDVEKKMPQVMKKKAKN